MPFFLPCNSLPPRPHPSLFFSFFFLLFPSFFFLLPLIFFLFLLFFLSPSYFFPFSLFPCPSAKPYKVLHNIMLNKIAAMGIPPSALTPFHYTYSTGGLLGFYAKGPPTVASDLLLVRIKNLHITFTSSRSN